jgi:hypothetical protein
LGAILDDNQVSVPFGFMAFTPEVFPQNFEACQWIFSGRLTETGPESSFRLALGSTSAPPSAPFFLQ